MEEVKSVIRKAIEAQLSAAPASTAKTELIEELSDNLYCRYQDMIGAGVEEGEALDRALNDLGDVGELVCYLRELAPGEPLPEAKSMGNQLDDMLKDVEDVVRSALGQAKSAIREATETIRDSGFRWKSGEGKAEIHVENDADEADASGENADEQKSDGEKCRGWEFSAGVNTDEKKFFMGGKPTEPDQNKDVAYGVGYDKEKGGFYAQWGERKEYEPVTGPIPADAIRGLDIQIANGDVELRMTQSPDGDVLVGGDIDELEVTRSEDGILVIRQGKTASSSFFFLRGMHATDVVLDLPCRDWAFWRVSTANGDVTMDGDAPVEQVVIKTASGDLNGRLPRCGRLDCKSASGDMSWKGDVAELTTNMMSGDVQIDGRIGKAQVHSMSGDLKLYGSVQEICGASMSGDVYVESDVLPAAMELTSKSGDCEARIPDGGSFTVNFKTTSGSFRSDFFQGVMGGKTSHFTYGEGGPAYSISSISGDLRLMKF